MLHIIHGINSKVTPPTKEELEKKVENYKKDQKLKYIDRNIDKYKRLETGSLDESNIEKYHNKRLEWEEYKKKFEENNNLNFNDTIKDDIINKKVKEDIKMSYEDITQDMFKNAKPNEGIVEKQNYIDIDGTKYNIDGHNVVYNHDEREVEVAQLLNKTFGGDVEILPNINIPQGIKTPDYLYNGEKIDLKRIMSKRANDCVKTALKNKEKQANNFIIDNTAQTVSDQDILKQIDEIYNSKGFSWIDKIYLIKGNEFIKIFKRT